MRNIIPMELTDVNSSIPIKLRPTYGGLPEYGTAEGDIASFITNINYPLKKLEADIVAQQDLHGYSHPWAGGAGKNKIPLTLANLTSRNTGGTWSGNVYTYRGITFTANTDNGGNIVSIKISGSASQALEFYFDNTTVSTAHILSITADKNSSAADFYFSSVTLTASGWSNSTINVPANTSGNIAIYFAGSFNDTVTIQPMLRLATVSDATFEPYTNICPIDGYDEAVVNVAGKNLLPLTVQGLKSINTSGTWNNNAYTWRGLTFTLNLDSGGNVISIKISGQATNYIDFYFARSMTLTNAQILSITADKNSAYADLYYQSVSINASQWSNASKPVPANTSGNIGIYCDSSFNDTVTIQPMLRLASVSDATFEPYNGSTYTTDLDDTYYGGMLNVTTGELVVTHGFKLLGELTWDRGNAASGHWRFIASFAQIKLGESSTSIPPLICSQYDAVSLDDIWVGKRGVTSNIGNHAVIINDELYSDATSFKNALTANNAQLVYELATPQTVQLTPQEVETVIGQNHIWANSGQVYVEYHFVEDFEE